jgi:hypothetical protein
MPQNQHRHSGRKRQPRDLYQTPPSATLALVPHLPRRVRTIWECACGDGHLAAALRSCGYEVVASDIDTGTDFLSCQGVPPGVDAVITNPPYRSPDGKVILNQFIEHALNLMQPTGGLVAMLLPNDSDTAKRRPHFFGDCPSYAKKVIVTERIVWVGLEGPNAAPKANHAWFVWDWRHRGPMLTVYQSAYSERAKAMQALDQADRVATRRPAGTTAAAALRRLRTQRPDLHALVLGGQVSANRAMIIAGFRREGRLR